MEQQGGYVRLTFWDGAAGTSNIVLQRHFSPAVAEALAEELRSVAGRARTHAEA